ncbi:MAG: tetratricopeptide repeat protein [Gammaproteobacteria bacterium]|jgi:type IV pilus assembly protein PilF|nr:tetratricopeptide repeat protein [Gammaproteobacteria bacterium]
MRALAAFAAALAFATLGSCITTTTGHFKPEVSAEQAASDYSHLALAYLDANDVALARKYAQTALQFDSRAADSLGVLALIAQREGDAEVAKAYFEKALRAAPAAASIRNNYAALLFETESFDDAFDELLRVVADTSYAGRAAAYENLGVVALRLNRLDDAKQAFNKASQLDSARYSDE